MDQQPPSPLVLIQQLRQKLAAHLPSTRQHDKLNNGCLLLQVAAAHGKEDTLPPAHKRFSEADLVCQVSSSQHRVHPTSAVLDRCKSINILQQHSDRCNKGTSGCCKASTSAAGCCTVQPGCESFTSTCSSGLNSSYKLSCSQILSIGMLPSCCARLPPVTEDLTTKHIHLVLPPPPI